MALQERRGFIGGGVMASAMVGGLIRSGLTTPAQVSVSDPYPGSCSLRYRTKAVQPRVLQYILYLYCALGTQVIKLKQ